MNFKPEIQLYLHSNLVLKQISFVAFYYCNVLFCSSLFSFICYLMVFVLYCTSLWSALLSLSELEINRTEWNSTQNYDLQ